MEPSLWQKLGEYVDLEPLDLHNITLTDIIAATQDNRWQQAAMTAARFFMGSPVVGGPLQAQMPFAHLAFPGMPVTPGAKVSSAMWPFRVAPKVGVNVNSQFMPVSEASR